MRFHEALHQAMQGNCRRLYTNDDKAALPRELGWRHAYDGCPDLKSLIEEVYFSHWGRDLCIECQSGDRSSYRYCAERAKKALAMKFGAQLADYAVDSISFALWTGFSLDSYNDLNRRLADIVSSGSRRSRSGGGTGGNGSRGSSGQYRSSGTSWQYGFGGPFRQPGSGGASGQHGNGGSAFRRCRNRPQRPNTAGGRIPAFLIRLALIPVWIFMHGWRILILIVPCIAVLSLVLSAIAHFSGDGERLPAWAADPIIAVIGGGFGVWGHFTGGDESWGLADDVTAAIGAMHAEQASPEEYETALGWFRRGASWGGARSAYLAGVMSYYGLGTAKDYKEALRLFRLPAGQGMPAAENAVGVMHYFGRGVPQNYAEAFRWFRKAAERGMPAAENNLASMYLTGQGTAKSPENAEKWFRKAGKSLHESSIEGVIFDIERPEKGSSQSADSEILRWREAADKGDAAAEYYLGTLSENGIGAGRDEDKAILWYERAAGQGYRPAADRLQRLGGSSSGSGGDNAARSVGAGAGGHADAGEAAAAPAGDDAVPMDEETRRLAAAAAGGDAGAQYRFGKMLSEGKGVPEDRGKAAEWLRKAADQGSTDAYSHLCLMYHAGFLRGTAGGSDSAEEEWLRKGAEHGSSGCMSYLGDMLIQGRGDHADPGEAPGWYRKAAGLGNVRAAYTLGMMYRSWNGVRQDYAESAKWFRKGAEQGDPLSERSLGLAYRKGLGVPRNEAEAEKWLERSERHSAEMAGGLRTFTPDGELEER